jgi:chemotaxis protein histidine kinase CheA
MEPMNDLRDLQRDYLADLRQTVVQMREHGRGLASQSNFKSAFPALLFLAHQLKGSGGSLGFPRISELARKMSEELNLFLDQEHASRPTPEELSQTLVALSGELESEIAIEERQHGCRTPDTIP